MTKNYNIHIINTKTFLKATYRNGKFRKLEFIRGKLDRGLMDSLGKAIPVNESEIEGLNKLWFNRVNYEIEVKEKSLYTQFLDQWYSFYEKMTGFPPKFTGADGKALKQIITYLKQINRGSEQEAMLNWQLILENYETLKEFHKDNTDLKYINSRLNVIIREIIKNNGSDTTGTNSSIRI